MTNSTMDESNVFFAICVCVFEKKTSFFLFFLIIIVS